VTAKNIGSHTSRLCVMRRGLARSSESERDHALSFHWKPVDLGVLDPLGLPPARNMLHAHARASVVTEAYIIGRTQPDRSISYSRRRDFYTDQQRYRGTAYTYNTVLSAVDELADFGLLENVVAHPGSRGRQSTFRATPELVDAFDRPISAHYDPHELIQLKDADGRLVQYRDTAETERMRRELVVLNEALAAVELKGSRHGAGRIRNSMRQLCPLPGAPRVLPGLKRLISAWWSTVWSVVAERSLKGQALPRNWRRADGRAGLSSPSPSNGLRDGSHRSAD